MFSLNSEEQNFYFDFRVDLNELYEYNNKQRYSSIDALYSIFNRKSETDKLNRFEIEKLTNIEQNDLINHIYFI